MDNKGSSKVEFYVRNISNQIRCFSLEKRKNAAMALKLGEDSEVLVHLKDFCHNLLLKIMQ